MKHRVIIVNKFYYRRGGDCVCTLNLEELLKANGHEVAVFAMKHPENLPSQWDSYWPDEVDFGGSAKQKLDALGRTLGMGQVRDRFKRLLRDFRPDVVHLNNIHSYLSPVVGEMARKAGAKVVWTLHDYKLICPSYSCLRQGSVCELCFKAKHNVLTRKCMKGSLAASIVAYAEALRWNPSSLDRFTSAFICPSAFMARKMEQGGFNPQKLVTLSNFLPPQTAQGMMQRLAAGHKTDREPYYCYVGRLSHEKGVATLLEAASQLPFELRVAGDGPLSDEFRQRFGHLPNIKFLGRLGSRQVEELLASARFSVLPSECYENNPLGVIESLCAGTPAVGAEMGGIPELITPGSGFTFTSGAINSLREAIVKAWNTRFDHSAIASDALKRFSATAHYNKLTEIYSR